jgi:hypothetical protein
MTTRARQRDAMGETWIDRDMQRECVCERDRQTAIDRDNERADLQRQYRHKKANLIFLNITVFRST